MPVDHAIEHAVGVYIALMGLACLVGILTYWLTHIPYTIGLTIVGMLLAIFHVGPELEETGFSKELIFFVLLPPLLFQGALHMQLDRLRRHSITIGVFATFGVLATTLLIGFGTWMFGVFGSLLLAMLFGALITPTDPVSVLAIFKTQRVPKDLSYLVEGESLFNDGTGVVIFSIVLAMFTSGGEFHLVHALGEFLKVTIGGTILGIAMGYVTYLMLKRLHAHLLENALCLLCCYASFWIAEHFHLSGVIATVCAGLLIGNRSGDSMSNKTSETVTTFFESIDFLINSALFILIGLELQAIPLGDWAGHLPAILISIAVVLAARAIVVYAGFFGARQFEHTTYPSQWSHVMFWGGLRGSIPIALLLGLPHHEAIDPHRPMLLAIGFSVVCFSLIIQGFTMKPLIAALGIKAGEEDDPAPEEPAKEAAAHK